MHAAACSALARTLSEHCRVSGCCRQQPLSCPALPLARLHCTTAPIQAPFPPRRLNWLRSLQRQLGSEGLAPSAQRIFFDPLVPGFTGGLEDGVSRPLKRVHASAWAALPSSPLASTASDCCVDVLMSPPPPCPCPWLLPPAACCLQLPGWIRFWEGWSMCCRWAGRGRGVRRYGPLKDLKALPQHPAVDASCKPRAICK